MNTFLGTFNIILVVALICLVVAVWVTAKLVFSILFLIVLVLLGLSVTGVLGSLFNKQ